MEKKIKFYENRILEDKLLINQIKKESIDNEDKALLNKRIDHLQNEIDFMNQELMILRSKVNELPVEEIKESTAVIQQTELADGFHNPFKVNKQKVQEKIPVQPKIQKQPKEKNMESAVGKNLMSIFASILIFVSIIFFSKLLYDNLTDSIKTIVMFLTSFAITGVGLFLMKKNPENKIYLSISSCGLGSIYISLFISNILFKTLNNIVLYLLLAIWIFFVCLLSKKHSKIFQFIGQIGITISVLLGAINCVKIGDENSIFEFLLITIYFTITSLIFFFMHLEKDNFKNIINNTFNFINTIILTFGCIAFKDLSLEKAIIIVITTYLLFTMLIQYFKTTIEKNNIVFGVFNAISLFLISIALGSIFDAMFIPFIIYIVLLAINEFKSKSTSTTLLNLFFVVMIFITSLDFDVFNTFFIGYLIFSTLFVLYGLKFKRKEFNIYGIGYFFICTILTGQNLVLHPILITLELLLIAYVLKKYHYDTLIKIGFYTGYILCLYLEFINIISTLESQDHYDIAGLVKIIGFIVVGLFNYLMWKTKLGSNWETDEKEIITENTCRTINGYLMTMSSVSLFNTSSGIEHLWLILITTALFVINTKEVLEKNTIQSGLYVGAKYTALAILILNSFEVPNFLLSIVCLIIAIANIIYGFKENYKSLRIYGLLLALFNVVKLLLFDISFSNTIGLAFSLFICGSLCFAISFIYNKMEQKFKNN